MDWIRNIGMKNINVGWSQNDFQYEMLVKNFNLSTRRIFLDIQSPLQRPQKNIQFEDDLVVCELCSHKRPELFLK